MSFTFRFYSNAKRSRSLYDSETSDIKKRVSLNTSRLLQGKKIINWMWNDSEDIQVEKIKTF